MAVLSGVSPVGQRLLLRRDSEDFYLLVVVGFRAQVTADFHFGVPN